MPVQIGQMLGRDRIEEEIGSGGMGVVYRARDERLSRDLAIKVLRAGTLGSPGSRKRFRNEALMLSKLNHPAIQIIPLEWCCMSFPLGCFRSPIQ